MIDGVKIRVINTDPGIFLNNPVLDFKQERSIKTGEPSNKIVAEYKGLTFKIYTSGLINIQGSLHKFYNDGYHNHDDFHIKLLEEAINLFVSEFNLELRNCTLVNLEVGANVTPVIPTKEVLRYMYMHQKKEFLYGDFKNGTYKQASYREYYLKAYDKAQQHKLQREVFRFEIKMVTSRYINKFKIYTLEDLLNPVLLKGLCKHLIDRWREILMWDPSVYDYSTNIAYKNKLANWANPTYWSNLADDKSAYRNKYSREVKKYKFFQTNASDNIQFQMQTCLEYKLASLILTPEEYEKIFKSVGANTSFNNNQTCTTNNDNEDDDD